MSAESFRYIIGNSPKLPMANQYADPDVILFDHLKVSLEMLQEDQILVIHTDRPLDASQISRIEYALLNPSSYSSSKDE